MKKRQLFFAFLSTLIITALLHSVGSNGYYESLWWLDMVVHFVGGMCVGFGSLWFGARIGLFPSWQKRDTRVRGIFLRFEDGIPAWATLAVVAVGVGVVGPLWEVFEVMGWTWLGAPIPINYITDTLSDLLIDAIGACVAWLIAHRWWIA